MFMTAANFTSPALPLPMSLVAKADRRFTSKHFAVVIIVMGSRDGARPLFPNQGLMLEKLDYL